MRTYQVWLTALCLLTFAASPARAQSASQVPPFSQPETVGELAQSISWIDFVLDRSDKGDLILINPMTGSAGDPRLFLPVNRDHVIWALRLRVLDGQLTPARAAQLLLSFARDTAALRANLRAQRAELVGRRARLEQSLAAQARRPSPGPAQRPASPASSAAPSTGLIGDRFADVCRRLSTEGCASLYADMSVLLANYGRQIGWIDGMDPKAPQNDPGRGVLDRAAHYRHAMGPLRAGVAGLVEARLNELHVDLPESADLAMERDAAALLDGYEKQARP
jgi:hypothetical protein